MCCDLAASNGPKPQNKTREHPRGMSNRLEPKQTQCCKREEQQVGRRQNEGGRKHVRRGDVTEGVLFVAHLGEGLEKNQKYSASLLLQTGLSIQNYN